MDLATCTVAPDREPRGLISTKLSLTDLEKPKTPPEKKLAVEKDAERLVLL